MSRTPMVGLESPKAWFGPMPVGRDAATVAKLLKGRLTSPCLATLFKTL